MKNGVVGLARLAIVAFLLVVGSPIGAALAQSTASEAREVPPDTDESPAAPVAIVALDASAAREQLAARAASLDLDLATLLALRPGVADGFWWELSHIDARRSRGHVLGVSSALLGLAAIVLVGTAIGVAESCVVPCTDDFDLAFGIVGSAAGLVSLGLLGGAVVVHTEASDALSNWRDRVVFAAGLP